MCIFWEDDVAIPASCICHAAHQLGLQLPTHSLQECVNKRTDTLGTLGVYGGVGNESRDGDGDGDEDGDADGDGDEGA